MSLAATSKPNLLLASSKWKAPNKNFRKAKFFVYKEEMSTHDATF
jgi:hypothetical protein